MFKEKFIINRKDCPFDRIYYTELVRKLYESYQQFNCGCALIGLFSGIAEFHHLRFCDKCPILLGEEPIEIIKELVAANSIDNTEIDLNLVYEDIFKEANKNRRGICCFM